MTERADKRAAILLATAAMDIPPYAPAPSPTLSEFDDGVTTNNHDTIPGPNHVSQIDVSAATRSTTANGLWRSGETHAAAPPSDPPASANVDTTATTPASTHTDTETENVRTPNVVGTAASIVSDASEAILQTAIPLVNAVTGGVVQDFTSPLNGVLTSDGLWQISGPWIGTDGNLLLPSLAQIVPSFDGMSGGFLELSVPANLEEGSEIQSLQTYGYGDYQVRMQITDVPGVVASFFWIEAPNYGPAEWDIEFLTNESWIASTDSGIVHFTIHPSNDTEAFPLSFNPSLAFHTYGFDWTPGQIVFSVDGTNVFSFTSSDLTTTTTGYIMANTWTGNPDWGGGPPTQEATTVYDWMEYTPLCFLAGTLIQTSRGEVPIETLKAGDSVVTLGGKIRQIVWVGTGRVVVTRGRRSPATPVIVRKGALADNVPHNDLHVTKGHSFFLDGVLVPVEFLVNHRSILWDDWSQEVTIYHIELETHDVLLANGAPAESYRDDGNRWLFQNSNHGWHLPPQAPCAPVHSGGAVVDAIWLRLLARSGPRRQLPLTEDPDLHLVVDGERVNPLEQSAQRYVFRVKQRPRSVRMVSRCGVPQELGFARDARPLGVAVRQMTLVQGARQRTLDADAASLDDGYHAFEADSRIRWTDGDAAIPAALFHGIDRFALLIVLLGGTTRYLEAGARRGGPEGLLTAAPA